MNSLLGTLKDCMNRGVDIVITRVILLELRAVLLLHHLHLLR